MLYMFQAVPPPIIRSSKLYTQHRVFVEVFLLLTAIVSELEHQFQPDSPRQRLHNLHETYQLPRVQLLTPDDGHSRCPKHVGFRDKIKCWVLDASCSLFI
jgi:hypothetical protein